MKRLVYFLSLLGFLTLACARLLPSRSTATEDASPVVAPSQLEDSASVDSYDPARDPAQDVQRAIAIAQKEHKRILLEVGGDWCIWCHYMDEFYATHEDILQYRADHFILVKINFSEDNTNEQFLSQYPAVAGYPHIFILESDGTFLHSQDTAELENGADSYVPEVFMAFLQKWALP